MTLSRKIVVLYTDAGGGHRTTAEALKAVLESKTTLQVDLMNPYKKLISDVDLFARFTPCTDEDVYNRFVLAKGWSHLFCLVYYAATLFNIRLGTRESARRFAACWKQRGYDLVISVMPMSNQGIYRSVKALSGSGPVPFLVVMTDFAETMDYTWFPRQNDYFLVCGTPEAYAKSLAKPHPPDRAFLTSGLVVHPKFYDTLELDTAGERRDLGLHPDLLTGCVMYGGGGSPRMAGIAQALAGISPGLQMIFLCGKNQSLADQIRAMALPYPHVVKTFTHQVPYYLRISDFLVGKPGPGTISEALVSGILPVMDTRQVLPQERYNLGWIKQKKKGLTFRTIRELIQLIQALARESGKGDGNSRRARTENQAVFEIPAIVDQVLSACHGR